ncbi:MAG: type IV pilus assembly protein PilM [Fimbriimonadales bacterium]|nr:type IV pilus assembly protein PilM [Fimbriimonadales bacterium]
MAKQPSAAVGIDIGTRFIKVAEVRAGKPPVLTNVGIAPTPEGAVDAGGVVDKSAVATTLKRLLAETGIGTKQAVFSLAGQNAVVVRILEVPRMNPVELRSHMDWEIQRNIPFADTRVQSSYEIIHRPGEDPQDPNMEVVLAVAQQDAVDGLVDIADKVGLEPYAIDVEPLALGRSLVLSQPDMQHGAVVVINLGASATSIDIYDRGLLSFPRVLPTGGDMMTRAVADRLMVPEAEAEQLKVQLAEVLMGQVPFGSPFGVPGGGFYTPTLGGPAPSVAPGMPFAGSESAPIPGLGAAPEGEEAMPSEVPPSPFETPAAPEPELPAAQPATDARKAQVFQAIYPLLEELISEIRRSVEYFRSRHADVEIRQILLCGGGAVIPNLDQFVATSIGIPTAIANPLRGVQLNVRRHGPEYVAAHAHLLAVAIGMGMHPCF